MNKLSLKILNKFAYSCGMYGKKAWADYMVLREREGYPRMRLKGDFEILIGIALEEIKLSINEVGQDYLEENRIEKELAKNQKEIYKAEQRFVGAFTVLEKLKKQINRR